jgi:archaellin
MKTILVLSASVLVASLLATVSAQTTQKTDPKTGDITTTEPSDKYGAGGTHVTVSDKKYKLIREYYYDKAGKKREEYYPGEPKDNFPPETTYYDEGGKIVVVVVHDKDKGDLYYNGLAAEADAAQRGD